MKKLILFIGATLMASCAPGRSGEVVRVDIYCDSCEAIVRNTWYKSDESNTETEFSGVVDDYYTINIERYISDYPCIRADISQNFTLNPSIIYLIENSDTTHILVDHSTGYCY
jgi:hypothetical protein